MISYSSEFFVLKDDRRCGPPTTYLYDYTGVMLCENDTTHLSLIIIIYYTFPRPQTVIIYNQA